MELNKLHIVQKNERKENKKNGKERKNTKELNARCGWKEGKKNQNVKSRKQQLMDFDVFMYVRQYFIGFENVLSMFNVNVFGTQFLRIFGCLNLIIERSEL